MQKSVPEFAIFDAGISVHPSLPYLGASPDGKVFDPPTENKYGLLEIKFPFSKRGDTLEQAASDPNFYMEKHGETFCLKKDHFYYAQVQGQLAITGLLWCDFSSELRLDHSTRIAPSSSPARNTGMLETA